MRSAVALLKSAAVKGKVPFVRHSAQEKLLAPPLFYSLLFLSRLASVEKEPRTKK